jgi:hypothetical protein
LSSPNVAVVITYTRSALLGASATPMRPRLASALRPVVSPVVKVITFSSRCQLLPPSSERNSPEPTPP